MKLKFKLISMLLFSIIVTACNNDPKQNSNSKDKSALTTSGDSTTIVIATLSDGVATFVQDTTTLKSDWQELINTQTDLGSCVFSSIKIVPDSTASNYYLIASGTANSTDPIKSTIALIQDQPTCLALTGITVTCSTTDCSDEQEGCIPVGVACTKCGNSGKCSKVVTNSPSGVFPSISTGSCEE